MPGTRRLLSVFALALALACREPEPPPPPPPPSVDATVLVYETTVAHENRSFRWQVLTDGTRVRFGDETDAWRLIDTKERTVTFIDQVRRTRRSTTFDEALAARRKLLDTDLPPGALRATVKEEPAGTVDGRDAVRISVAAGGYTRTILVSTLPILPPGTSAMRWATDPLEPEYAGVIRDLMPPLESKQGTLLYDRNEIVHAEGTMSVETRLVSVTKNRLPLSLFVVPVGFSVDHELPEGERGEE